MIQVKVTLEKAAHKGRAVLKIVFEKNAEIQAALRPLAGLRWSQTMRCWYVLYTDSAAKQVFTLLHLLAQVDGLNTRGKEGVQRIYTAQVESIAQKNNTLEGTGLPRLSEEQHKQTEAFVSWMRSRRYSESTVKTYKEALSVFLRYYQGKALELINNDDLVYFNNRYILANKLSASYQNQIINAIKLFFKTIHLRSMDVELVHRPKQEHRLPNVLSKEEVKLILDSHVNYKHKVMLSLIYACGLRRSELLNLKPLDISSERGVVVIRQSKGKKDRIAPISENIIKMLRQYYKMYKPDIWLFEGQQKGQQYSGESLQKVLNQALIKANIKKPVTLHWLRHSYATHLLEKGTDLRYIQELLGHNSSRTTEIYTHVSSKSIQKITSPFDDL